MDVSIFEGRATHIALGISLVMNFALVGVVLWPSSDSPPAPTLMVATPVAAVQEPTQHPTTNEPQPVLAKEEPVQAKNEPVQAKEEHVTPKGVQVTVATIKGSIPQTMATAAKPYGDFLSATLSRILVWDMNLRRDLRAGDKVATSWHLGTSDTVVIDAARFHSQKFNRTTTAYRFKATGDKTASYWAADGTEVPHRLKHSPLAEYDQITSLLRDRPNHKGMDFKVAVGTPVAASFKGVVTRVNWNWKANGNCVEVKHDDGVVAKYLHLSKNKVKAGDRVAPGTIIALSGNTGHSTGPHLHYQLNRGKKVVDPIDYHGTIRRSLPKDDLEVFAASVKAANAKLASGSTVAAL